MIPNLCRARPAARLTRRDGSTRWLPVGRNPRLRLAVVPALDDSGAALLRDVPGDHPDADARLRLTRSPAIYREQGATQCRLAVECGASAIWWRNGRQLPWAGSPA